MEIRVTVSIYNEEAKKSVSIAGLVELEGPVGNATEEILELFPRLLRSGFKGAAARDVYGWDLNDEEIRAKLAEMSEDEFQRIKERERALSGV